MLFSGTGNRRVIGVVGDVRPVEQDREPGLSAYLTIRQHTGDFRWFSTATIVVRGAGAVGAGPSLRSIVLSRDPEMPPFNVRPLDDDVAAMVAGPRFAATLLGAFGGAALALAAIGVFGVMTYAAGRRTREIGVRIAMGASRAQVQRLMLGDATVAMGLGIAAGLVASVWLARTLTGLLYEVTPADPATIAPVALLLVAVGGLAAWIPTRRATRVSALEALRDE